MPVINPDTSDMIDFSPIEEGTYPATVLPGIEAKDSKAGNAMIVVKLNVEVDDGEARPRTANLVISGKGAYNFDQLLRACGQEEIAEQYTDPDQENPAFDTDELEGCSVQVVISHQLYNNEVRDQISGFLPA